MQPLYRPDSFWRMCPFKPLLRHPAMNLKNAAKVSQTFANIADSGPICPKPGKSADSTSGDRFPL